MPMARAQLHSMFTMQLAQHPLPAISRQPRLRHNCRQPATRVAVLSPRRPADEAGVAAEGAAGNGVCDTAAAAAAGSFQAAGQRSMQPPATHSSQQQELGIPPELLPRHLAIIMDGNSRWAAARGAPAAVGYQQGVEALRTVVQCCQRWGIKCLTVYAFSSENWRRPAAEVDWLLALMGRVLAAEAAELASAGVRLRFIGELSMLPRALQRQIESAELATADNCDLHLTVAVSYSGRQDLTLAVQEIARLAAAGQLHPASITPTLIEQYLATRRLPPAWRQPDLIVRTSGEQRLSNFLCWESAYSELYFSDAMWPDFREAELAGALHDYARRERRFGGRQQGSSPRGSSGGSSGGGGAASCGGHGCGGSCSDGGERTGDSGGRPDLTQS